MKEGFTGCLHIYYQCEGCGTISTFPQPDDAQIVNHYKKRFKEGNYRLVQEYMHNYLSVYNGFAKTVEGELAREKQSLKGLRVLDVGCFTGEFLVVMRDRGADVYGVDLQEDAVAIANRILENRVFKADLYQGGYPEQEYDIVTLLGVVEHVLDPVGLIQKAGSLQNKNGLIMIQTPDSSSIIARLLGKRWPPLEPIEHINLFSRKGLIKVLQESGYTGIRIKPHIKMLPVDYVFQNLEHFGADFFHALKHAYRFIPSFLKKMVLPFYGGEIVVTGWKKGKI